MATIDGTPGDDVLPGTPDDDTINGYGGNDQIFAFAGNDTIYGGDGDDHIDPFEGDDYVDGGAGVDEIVYAGANGVIVDLRAGYAESVSYGIDTLVNVENVTGSAADDQLLGDDGDNFINGNASNDTIYGFGGNDLLYGGNGNDFIRGYSGDDYMDGGFGIDRVSFFDPDATTGIVVDLNLQGIAQDTGHGMDTLVGIEQVTGTRYDDVIIGDGGDNWLWGGSDGFGTDGNDTISGNGGNDLIEVGSGNHTLDGGSGTDTLSVWGNNSDTLGPIIVDLSLQGSAQDTTQGTMLLSGFENLSGSIHSDTLSGDGGDNWIGGDQGNDSIFGGAGNDSLYGDGRASIDINSINAGPVVFYGDVTDIDPSLIDGNDVIEGGLGDDQIYGGGGSDTATYEHSAGAVEAYLYDDGTGEAIGADGYDQLYDVENLTGSAFDDVLLGNDDANVLTGLDGHDFLYGFGGNDTLLGGAGDDFLRGYEGDDILDGGAGIDRVSFYIGTSPPSAVTVDLNLQGAAQNTGYGMDTLIGVEHVSGTILSDTLIGDGGDNWLWGGSDGIAGGTTGDDTISGGGGNDLVEVGAGNHTLDGGTGNDTLSLSGETLDIGSAGVTFSLALQGAAQDSEQGMMTATGFENLSGTIYNDSLTGDDGANILAADAGDDSLYGGKGDDTLYGDGRTGVDTHGLGGSGPITTWSDISTFDTSLSPGNDTLNGGKGDDTLFGGGGDDVMSGDQGSDSFVIEANSGDDTITDFSKAQDVIVFDVSGVDDFGDLTLSASGSHDTLITWDTGDSVLVLGVKPSQLNASAFDFDGSALLSADALGFADPGAGHGHGFGLIG